MGQVAVGSWQPGNKKVRGYEGKGFVEAAPRRAGKVVGRDATQRRINLPSANTKRPRCLYRKDGKVNDAGNEREPEGETGHEISFCFSAK